jgi:membrane-associated protease RseP (regulator of RpoE activity)
MHFLMALVLVGIVVMGFGVPDNDLRHWTVGALSRVEAGPSPAQQAGIRLGDRIVAIDGRHFADFDAMATYIKAHPGDEVTVAVERKGRPLALTTVLANRNPNGDGVGFLGVGPEPDRIKKGPVSGTVESVKLTGKTMWLSVKGLASLFSPKGISGYLDTVTSSTKPKTTGTDTNAGKDRFVSIVGVVRIADDAAQNSVADLLGFLFAINIFIGLFNLVPLLPFDGGHVAIATYERIRSRKGKRYFADVRKMLPLTYAVVLILAFIFITSTYLDIAKPLSVK